MANDKVVRLMVGTDDNSVRCVVSLVWRDDATEEDVANVLTNAAGHALARFMNGPHEEARSE
jgi:hypothetical protein